MPKNLNNLEFGFSHILLLLAVLVTILILGTFFTANIKISKEFASNVPNVAGVLIAHGDDDSSLGSGNSGSGSSGRSESSGSSGSGSSGGSSGSGSSSDTIKTEFRSAPSASGSPASAVRVKNEQSAEKERIEVRFSEDEKIKTRVEEDRTRVDVYSGGVKVRYEVRDGRVVIKAETEKGEDVPEEKLFKIVDRVDKGGIKVATAGGQLLVQRNNIVALASFPLQVDLDTNQLIASTSAGSKILTILPDQAVRNMLAANVISRLNTQDLLNKARLGNLTSVSDVVTLGERNGLPVYEINGFKDQRLLGFIPVTINRTVFVSAETGQPVAEEQSLFASIIDLLSP